MNATHEIEIVVTKKDGFSKKEADDIRKLVNEEIKEWLKMVSLKSFEILKDSIIIVVFTSEPDSSCREVQAKAYKYLEYHIGILRLRLVFRWLEKDINKIRIKDIKVKQILLESK